MEGGGVVEGGGVPSLNFANPMQGFVEGSHFKVDPEGEHDSGAQE